ncbi:MAG: hypothetical protein JWO05_2057 [Gemmatimonadetes bacterium]|nr:hypothetical protein [Gemmatimonadota bacterium]
MPFVGASLIPPTMRTPRLLYLIAPLALSSACDGTLLGPLGGGASATNVAYVLEPSGDPYRPAGVLVTWDPPSDNRVVTFDVLARNSTGSEWQLRATTTSVTFHDAGMPQLQYLVASMDENGNELGRSRAVTVDDRNRLAAPRALTSVTLNGGVELSWDDNAALGNPAQFALYRVYSSSYDASRSRCDERAWALEGTTVSSAFLARNLVNGVTRCFAVSAQSRDGHESAWSDARQDTPRWDAQAVVLDASDVRPQTAAFLFYDSVARRYGAVDALSRVDADLVLERHGDGTLWLRPARSAVEVGVFGSLPIPSLRSIDRAPAFGYGSGAVQAIAGWGYAVTVRQADGTHYGALRVSYVGRDALIIDWSYQGAAGNTELSRIP